MRTVTPDPSQTDDDDQDRTAELIRIGTQLLEEIQKFSREGGAQFVNLAHRARTNRRLITGLMISFFLVLVITASMVVMGLRVADNNTRISRLTDRLNTAQTVQRQKALCPLYQLLKDQRSPAGRKAAPDKDAYDHAFEVIDSGYLALGCQQFIAGQSAS